jgi:tRNA (cmo5U34)-methyltransferase
VFDRTAGAYDRARRQLVPGFDEFYGAIIGAIPHSVHSGDEEIRVLDLGAGTGLLSAMVAEELPRARVTLLDFSTEMLEVARRRFASESERFDLRVSDYEEEDLPGGHEVIVSSLSIHHLKDSGKKALFRQIYEVLPEGGVFVNGDQALGETPEIERGYHEWWLRRAREAGVSEGDLADSLERIKQDKNAPLRSQMSWLSEAGFETVESLYEDHRFAVYSGRKPVANNGDQHSVAVNSAERTEHE